MIKQNEIFISLSCQGGIVYLGFYI